MYFAYCRICMSYRIVFKIKIRTVKNTSKQMRQLCVDAVNESIYSLSSLNDVYFRFLATV